MAQGNVVERALLLIQAGREEAAEALCRERLSGDPQDPLALLALGLSLVQKSEYADALQALEAAIAQLPEVSLAHSLRGVCLAALGRDKEALEAVRHADQLEPEHDLALHFLAGVAGRRWRTRNLARAALDRLEAISPDSASTALLRAGVEMRAFRPLRAFRAARRSVSLDPVDPDARAVHAFFVSLVKRRRGSELMHQAMVLDPGDQALRDLAISTGLGYWRPSLWPLFLINCLMPPMLPAFFLVASFELLIGRRRRFKKLTPELQDFLRQAVRIHRPYKLWRWVLIATLPVIGFWTVAVATWLSGGHTHTDWHLDSAAKWLLFLGLWGVVALAVRRRTLWWRRRASLLGLGDRKWTEDYSLKVLFWIVLVIQLLWTLGLILSVTSDVDVHPMYLFAGKPHKVLLYAGLWAALWWIRKRRRQILSASTV